MDTEYHYWLTGLIAKRSGFNAQQAAAIAHASEYVDHNSKSYEIMKARGDKSDTYVNEISQTMDICKPRSERIHIYPLFHFIPGDPEADSAARKDGLTHALNTTPDNTFANNIIDAALAGDLSGDADDQLLHSIGIASHAYVDTWAHQNFIGIKDKFNQIGMDLKPNIGHADAGFLPDIPSLIWEDERLVNDTVDNKQRFMDASQALFAKYCGYNAAKNVNSECGWDALATELDGILGSAHKADSKNVNKFNREKKYPVVCDFMKKFDSSEWFNEAVIKEGMSRWWRQEKEQTDWYHFQQAVIKHRKFAFDLIKPRFKAAGIELVYE